MASIHVYLLPGLGTDQRVFEKLKIEATTVKYLPFLEPGRKESIASYALRMAQTIEHTQGVVLVGLSLGGILAQEIAAQRAVDKIILLSSVKTPSEIPFWMRLGKLLPFHKIPISVQTRAKTVRTWGRLFGVKHLAAVSMFKDMMLQYSDWYFQWSTHQIIHWQGVQHNSSILHIHGTNDLVFPLRNINNAQVIKDGTHSLVYTHASVVNKHIHSFIYSHNS